MAIKAYVLLGGVMPAIGPLPAGWDGDVDSVGMEGLAKMLGRLPDVKVVTKDWGDWASVLQLIGGDKSGDKVALIGFSGGASRATWLSNTAVNRQWPHIDLMVGYDPSPKWQVLPLHANVLKAICYFNEAPDMPSLVGMLGGGEYVPAPTWGIPAEHILTRKIAMQHLAVQFMPSLHAATVQAVKDLSA
jgi:hypothetical protein